MFILYIVLLFIFGLSITAVLNLKVNILERLALSYLLGLGLLTFLVFLLNFAFALGFSLMRTMSILSLSTAASIVFGYRRLLAVLKEVELKKITLTRLQLLIGGIIFLIFAYTLLVNSFWPINDWDALALYDFRAKIFLIEPNLVNAALSNGYFIQYPLLTSLAHLFAYQTGLSNPKFIYSLFYLSFIIIFYYSLKRNTTEKKALLFTFVAAIIPEILQQATVAYTNLPYTVYFCTGIFYLYEWLKRKDKIFLILSAFLVGLSTWVRILEVFWVIPLFVVFFMVLRKRLWKEFVLYGTVIAVFYLPWKYFMVFIGKLSPQPIAGGSLDVTNILRNINFGHIYLVLDYLYRNVFSTWGLTFMLFVLVAALIYTRKEKGTDKTFLYITLLFFVFLVAGTFGFSLYFPGWQDIPDSARRMSMVLLPIMYYSIALYI